jgi:spore coat protein U-like protein
MYNFKKITLGLTAFGALASFNAFATDSTQTINVTGYYDGGCSILSTSDLNFGNLAPLLGTPGAPVTGIGSITARCEGTLTSATLTSDGGLHKRNDNVRQLKADNEEGTLIAYHLYKKSNYTDEILPDDPSDVLGDLQNSTREMTFYGKITPADLNGQTTLSSGLYKDVITATLSWE